MTDGVLLDTDVFSFAFKRDTRAELYRRDIAGRPTYLSFMTIAELREWSLRRRWGRGRADRLEDALRQCVVLFPDEQMTRHWAEITHHRRSIGRPIHCGDCWTAACAVRHGLTLLTHNGADYADVSGLTVVSH